MTRMQITRARTVTELDDLLTSARSAVVAWNRDGGGACETAAFRFSGGIYFIGLPVGILSAGTEVAVLVDDGEIVLRPSRRTGTGLGRADPRSARRRARVVRRGAGAGGRLGLWHLAPAMSLSPSDLKRVDEALVVRLATISKRGTPLVTPLWFARDENVIHIGTRRGSPHTRNVVENPRVVLMFFGRDDQVLRVSSIARLRDYGEMSLARKARMAWRYFLKPAALTHFARNWRKLAVRKAYYRERTDPAVLEVTLDEAERMKRRGLETSQPRSQRSRNQPWIAPTTSPATPHTR